MAAARKPWLKPLVFAGAAAPLLWLASRALRGALGPDPVAEVLNRLGLYAISLLFCSLACTPLQIVLGWNWPLRVRRMLGLFAFFYASLHLSTYVFVDQGLDLGSIGKDIAKRRFVTVGFAAWCALLPLAITSTSGWVRRLGFRRWKALHRLAYVAAVLGCIHFIWRFKTAPLQPVLFAALLAVLLVVRIAGRASWSGIRARPERGTLLAKWRGQPPS
jgi:sulfoxide reductase heme-binding subunit YedZ